MRVVGAKRLLVSGILTMALFCLLVGLTGCIPIVSVPDPDASARVVITVVPPLSVIVDARETGAATFEFHFGDGNSVRTDRAMVFHTYAQSGLYPVIVYWEGQGQDGNIGRRSGPAIGGDARRDANDDAVSSAYALADLREPEGPCTTCIALRNNAPTVSFWWWEAPTFLAVDGCPDQANEDVWHQWVATRIWPTWNVATASWGPPYVREEMARYVGREWRPGKHFFRLGKMNNAPRVPKQFAYEITLHSTDRYRRVRTCVMLITLYVTTCS